MTSKYHYLLIGPTNLVTQSTVVVGLSRGGRRKGEKGPELSTSVGPGTKGSDANGPSAKGPDGQGRKRKTGDPARNSLQKKHAWYRKDWYSSSLNQNTTPR